MRISDWSSDECSSDLRCPLPPRGSAQERSHRSNAYVAAAPWSARPLWLLDVYKHHTRPQTTGSASLAWSTRAFVMPRSPSRPVRRSFACQERATYTRTFSHRSLPRSEEHTSELQSLMRISYAVFCL